MELVTVEPVKMRENIKLCKYPIAIINHVDLNEIRIGFVVHSWKDFLYTYIHYENITPSILEDFQNVYTGDVEPDSKLLSQEYLKIMKEIKMEVNNLDISRTFHKELENVMIFKRGQPYRVFKYFKKEKKWILCLTVGDNYKRSIRFPNANLQIIL